MRVSASTGEVSLDGSITCWGVTSTMKIARHFTIDGATPYQGIEFRTTASEIKNPDGSVVFSHTGIEVPAEGVTGSPDEFFDALAQHRHWAR